MARHSIAWTIESGGRVRAAFTCHGKPGEDWCLITCNTCIEMGAETITQPERSPDGTWSHTCFDSDLDRDVEHAMVANTACNYVEWMHNDPGLIPELYDGDDQEVVNGPVTFAWEGDYFTWEYAAVVPA